MNRPKIILWLIITFIGNVFNMYGTGPKSPTQFINHNDWNFVENKGQLISSDIKYYGYQGAVNLYCKPGMISFVFTKIEKAPYQISEATGLPSGFPLPKGGAGGFGRKNIQPQKITTCRADLILLNSNPSAQIIASEQQEYYENYYTANTPEEGITHVRTYKTITYKSIYPNIDFILHSKEGGLEYEFIVYPGGKVSDIQIQWKGLEEIKKLKNLKIEYSFGLGKMTESAPTSYQGIAIHVGAGLAPAQSENINNQPGNENYGAFGGGKPRPYMGNSNAIIPSHFILKNNRVGFATGHYDKTKPLIIDPFLSWGTYFGGIDFESGNAVAADKSGNVYITGYAESQTGITTSGAFQTSFGGGDEDAFLAKFNTSGKILWSTYYGGNGDDFGNGVSTDESGNIYIDGETGSSGMATSGAYQTNNIGGAFLAKFAANGFRIWSTYYSVTSCNGVCTDKSGSVFIVGYTNLSTSIATSGAYQTSVPGTYQAFLAKFNAVGTIQWATYFGRNNETFGFGVATDEIGNAYITGWTSSSSGIATKGANQTSLIGTTDAFLAKFNSTGSIQWATYFGGYPTQGHSVATDKYGDVYMTGNTSDTIGIATKGAYQTSLSHSNADPKAPDAFIAKFNGVGAIQWATYYGGPLPENCFGIASDEIGNVYITGETESNSGIATTGSYQTSFGGGNEDAFLAEFSNSGACLWATYYGGSGDEWSNGVASDGFGNIYITGQTLSTSGIATSNTYQTTLAGRQNAFLAQFNFKANYDASLSFEGIDSNVCAGKESVYVNLVNNGNDPFDSLNISWSLNGKIQPVNHWKAPAKPGLPPGDQTSVSLGSILFTTGKNDTIIAWSSRPDGQVDSVPSNDTTSIIINVNPLPVPDVGPSRTICQYDKIAVGVNKVGKDTTFSWTSKPAGITSNLSFLNVDPYVNTTYYLTETVNATGCSNTNSVTITVNPAPPAKTIPDQTICIGDSVNIGDTASKGFTYNWTSTPSGFSSTLSNPLISPASTTSYTLTETNTSTGCKNSNSVKISVNQLPVANVGQPSYSICNGTHVKIGANAQSGITYLWSSSPAGYSSTISNPVVDPLAYTNYYLTVTDTATGCVNKNFAKVAVSILKAPLIDVGKNQSVCVGVSAQIGSIPVVGYTYSWTSNPVGFTSTAAEPNVKPLVTSSYSLIVTDTHGCTNFDSVTITVNSRPQPKTGIPQNTCSGTAIKLGAPQDSGHAYLWTSKPAGFGSKISDPVDSPKVSTEYYLKETILATGCADSDSVKITVKPSPNAQFDVKNINGYEYQFNIQKPNYPGLLYHWTFGDTASTGSSSTSSDTGSGYKVSHVYPQNGVYMVYLTISLSGYCTVIDSYMVVVNVTPSFDIFPNPFGLQTNIKYVLENAGHVKITMTDDIGRFIGTLVDNQLPRGEYITIFDAGAWKTRPAVYFIIYQLDDKITVRKIVQIDSIFH